MTRTIHRLLATGVVVALATAAGAAAAEIPPRPEELTYQPLVFEVPRAEAHRHQLSNGIPVYVVEDHELPLVDVTVSARVGAFVEPPAQPGLASLTGQLMRQGGTEALTAEELDERLDFLAIDLSSSIGDTSGSFRMNGLSSVLDDGLDLLFDVMARPRFQESRIEVAKSNVLEEMKQRNDHPASIANREWQWLMYGRDHFSTRLATAATLASISRDDMRAFHETYLRPEGMIVAVAGDVDTERVLAELEGRFAAWPAGAAADVPWPPPAPSYEPKPGLYHVEKDIPQTRAQIGHLGLEWEDWSDPGNYAVMVMNDILGGGGFTSRITKRIRSDEGLAYSAGSSYGIGTFWPSTFSMYYQSKNPTAGYAAKIAVEEMKRIQEQPVSDEELQTAKNSFVETFPRRFESSTATANLFAADEMIGRPHDYWYEYRDRIRAVDGAAVQAAAREHLHPDRLVFLLVGPWEGIAGADQDERGRIQEVAGEPVHLPLRDPLTLEPMPQ